jgi:hypothetical protein
MVPSQRRYNSFECSSIEHWLVVDDDDDDDYDSNGDDSNDDHNDGNDKGRIVILSTIVIH